MPASADELISRATTCRQLAAAEKQAHLAAVLLEIAADYEKQARELVGPPQMDGVPHRLLTGNK